MTRDYHPDDRDLLARAFSTDAAPLTEDERARLAALLTAKDAGTNAAQPAPEHAPEPAPETPVTSPGAAAAASDDDLPVPVTSATPEPEPTKRMPRALSRAIIIGAVALALMLGFVGGSLLAPRGPVPPPASDYDPDSLHLSGIIEGVPLWFATQDGGEKRCVIVTATEAIEARSECYDFTSSVTDLYPFDLTTVTERGDGLVTITVSVMRDFPPFVTYSSAG